MPVVPTLQMYPAIYCKYLKVYETDFRRRAVICQNSRWVARGLYSLGFHVKKTSQRFPIEGEGEKAKWCVVQP